MLSQGGKLRKRVVPATERREMEWHDREKRGETATVLRPFLKLSEPRLAQDREILVKLRLMAATHYGANHFWGEVEELHS